VREANDEGHVTIVTKEYETQAKEFKSKAWINKPLTVKEQCRAYA